MDQCPETISFTRRAHWATPSSQCQGKTPQVLARLLTRLPGVGMDSHSAQSESCSASAALPASSHRTRSQGGREGSMGKAALGCDESRGRRSSYHWEQRADLSPGNGACDRGGLVLRSV